MSVDTYTREQIQDYSFADVEVPAGYDPDSGTKVVPGRYLCEVVTYEIAQGQEFKCKDQETSYLDQLRPHFKILPGQPCAGAVVMDFLPMPSGPMNTLSANRWGHFLKRLGMEPPKGKLVPPGFKLDDLIGKRLVVIVEENDQPGAKFKTRVPFFGYDLASAGTGGGHAGGNSRAGASKPAVAQAPTQKVEDVTL